jgi:hypothetical protein
MIILGICQCCVCIRFLIYQMSRSVSIFQKYICTSCVKCKCVTFGHVRVGVKLCKCTIVMVCIQKQVWFVRKISVYCVIIIKF